VSFQLLADLTVLLHGAFIVFVVFGAWLAWRWRWVAWVHVPCAAWGAMVELAGWVCPLTPLENAFRARAGEAGYRGGFIEHYVVPAIYPAGLTRAQQIVLGAVVIAINAVAYGLLIRRGASPR
jgi:Protein of Unknown function (DUF2784)